MSNPFAGMTSVKEPEVVLPAFYPDLTPHQRRLVRLKHIEKQRGRCYYCDTSLSSDPAERIMELDVNPDLFPPKFFDSPIHLHHNHTTGMTIGAVHAHCNAVLWQYLGE